MKFMFLHNMSSGLRYGMVVVAVSFIAGITTAASLDVARFGKELAFTTSGYDGSSELEHLPVLVRLSEEIPGFAYADVGATVSDVYGSLRFADDSGTSLDYEVECWDTSGESVVWVSLPRLDGRNVKFTAYWSVRSNSALPEVFPTNVWISAGYVGVWHFTNTSSDKKYIPDATGRDARLVASANHDNIQGVGSTVDSFPTGIREKKKSANGTPFRLAAWPRLSATNTSDWTFSLTGYSTEVWYNSHGLGSTANSYIFASAAQTKYGADVNWNPHNGIQVYEKHAYLVPTKVVSSDGAATNSVRVYSTKSPHWADEATNCWHWLSAVWPPVGSDRAAVLYEGGEAYDGGLRQLATHLSVVHAIDFTAPPGAAFNGAMGIVGGADNSGSPDICCDEARVRRGISSKDWIQANWDTQRVGSDFLTAGTVKVRNLAFFIIVR